MIIFCHLLNDNSGSPVVLREAIHALGPHLDGSFLLVGSQGRGQLDIADVPIRRYWYRRSNRRIITLLTYAASQFFLYRALSRATIPEGSLIYVNTLLPFGAALWGWRNRRPVLYHVHEISITPSFFRWILVKIVELTARHVFYVSEDHRMRLEIRGVPSTILYNPIDPEIARRGFATPYAPRRAGYFEVLMLASPRNYKGVPEYLDLARRLSWRDDIRFTLVLNAEPPEIEAYLSQYCLSGNVLVHHRTDAPEEFYAKANVLLNLSRVDMWLETFGLTIVEGMAFGLPAIAPPVGGPSEIITHGQEGFLVDSRDSAALDQHLLALADDPNTTLAMSAAARRRARDFSQARFSEELRALIASLHS